MPATFWYGLPGAKGNVEPDTKSATAPVARKREDVVEVLRVPGVLEGEVLKVASMTGGTREIQEIADQRWSDDRQLWWRDGKPGDKLTLEFPVEKSGQYRVLVDLTKARDYGIVRLTVDGNNPREFDRYHPSVEHDRLELGSSNWMPERINDRRNHRFQSGRLASAHVRIGLPPVGAVALS